MPIDYNNYPKKWPQIRAKILKRSGHCCDHCGVSNYAVGYRTKKGGKFVTLSMNASAKLAQASKYILLKGATKKLIIIVITVAHLDHDEWNHDVKMDRLAALCQKCHFNYDRNDNANRKAYGKHYKRNQLSIV